MSALDEWLRNLAVQMGYPGVFLVSLIGAVSIVYPIPYTLVIIWMGAILNPFFVAIAGGLGSAIGELFGYTLGYYGRAIISKERQRKMDYMLKVFNRYGPLAIFIFALTPLPDDLLFIPPRNPKVQTPQGLHPLPPRQDLHELHTSLRRTNLHKNH